MTGKVKRSNQKFFESIAEDVHTGEWEKVRGAVEAYVEDNGPTSECLYLLALADFAENDFAAAIAHARSAFESSGSSVKEYADLLAILYALASDLTQATFYAKMASANPSSDLAKKLWPESVPEFRDCFLKVRQDPFKQDGLLASGRGAWSEAEHWFRQHLAFNPDDPDGYLGLANSLMVRGLFRSAVESMRGARHVFPLNPQIAQMLGTALTAVGEIAEGRSCHAAAARMAPDDLTIQAVGSTDAVFDPEAGIEDVAGRFRAWGDRFGMSEEEVLPPAPRADKKRLTVGYLVGALHRSGTGVGVAEILAHHDPQRFRIVGFGLGELFDPFNVVFQKCFESWLNTQDTDPLTFASMVAAEGVDILVDLSGFTTPNLLAVFGARVAPVQLAWLGSPAGTGLANMDGMLTDEHLDPLGQDDGLYREKLVRLASGAPVLNLPSAWGVAPEDRRPSTGVTFAADATLNELSLSTVEIWADILHALPEATLILRDHDFQKQENASRVIGLFGNHGLAHRVDVLSATEMHQLFAEADICLMPPPSMRPEVAVAALEAGLPVVALAGEARHRRTVGSVLHHLGLAEDTVRQSSSGYRELALEWASGTDRRRQFRASLNKRLASAPLCDSLSRTRELESAYEQLWKDALAKRAPKEALGAS